MNGVQGVFPSNYVQQREDPPPTPPTASHPSAGQGVTVLGKPIIAKVVAAYTRTKDTQLNLTVGDLVKVTTPLPCRRRATTMAECSSRH